MTPPYNHLSVDEQKVIENKNTETPFSGEYDDFYKTGTYICRRCNQQIFSSNTKFDAQCGWPSFDDAIPGSVKLTPDTDGQRTEVTCNQCNGHLGHLFEGEGFTASNKRYCINSLSLKFIPKEND